MTTAVASLYGRFDRPRSQHRVSVNTGFSELVPVLYQQWQVIVPKHSPREQTHETVEALYQEALAILEPHSKTIQGATQKDLERVISNTFHHSYTGLFASALHNLSEVETIEAVGRDCMAHKLPRGKKVVIKPSWSSEIETLGFESQGTVYNYADCGQLAAKANGGVVVNLGNPYSFASGALDGMFVNFGSVKSFGPAIDGNYFNFGTVKNFWGHNRFDGLIVNLGEMSYVHALSEKAVSIMAGKFDVVYDDSGLHIFMDEPRKTGSVHPVIITYKRWPILGIQTGTKRTRLRNEVISAVHKVELCLAIIDAMRKMTQEGQLAAVLNSDWGKIKGEIEQHKNELGELMEKI